MEMGFPALPDVVVGYLPVAGNAKRTSWVSAHGAGLAGATPAKRWSALGRKRG